MKLKRILAIFIDWNLSGIPALLYSLIVLLLVEYFPQASVFIMLFAPVFVFSFPLIFVYRDVIFKGRSLAKRLFKLEIVDLETNNLPSKSSLVSRNLFFFILPVEIILIIIKNRTLGDMITNTIITKHQSSEKI